MCLGETLCILSGTSDHPKKGHGSAGGANVLKLVARGPGPKLLKFGGPLMSSYPRRDAQTRAQVGVAMAVPTGYG